MQNLHKEFIWGGELPKIKHCTLIGKYEEGGLKDVDIEAKFSALKFLWIKKLKDSTNHHPWQVVACELLSTFGGDKLLHSNLKLSDYCKSILKDIPLFYQAVIRQWASLSRHPVENVYSILAQSIWNNFHIKANGKSLYNNVMMNKGIYTIADLVDEKESFKPWGTVSLEFSLEPVEFLHWYGILQCIHTEWKQKLHRDTFLLDGDQLYRESIKISLSNNTIPVLDSSTKSIYRSLVQSKFKPPTSKQYFISKFDITGDVDSWKNIYSLPRKVTLDSKTRTFQYKVLNNILYLNHQMFRMKIVSLPLCSFCGESSKTAGHLFLRCRYASEL